MASSKNGTVLFVSLMILLLISTGKLYYKQSFNLSHNYSIIFLQSNLVVKCIKKGICKNVFF